jgi:predicted component of type VI protein secretion system
MAKLVFVGKECAGRVHEFTAEKTLVGRAPHNQLVIQDSSVSADHCEILVFGTEVIVREHGSKNGTFVDDFPVKGQMPVRSGQILRFGEVETRLELGADDELSDASVTSLTAVHLVSKLEREARKAPVPTPVPTPVLDQAPPAETIILAAPTPAAADRPAPAAVQAPPAPPARRTPVLLIALVFAAILVLLLLLRWLR